jgi:hypothetical protein
LREKASSYDHGDAATSGEFAPARGDGFVPASGVFEAALPGAFAASRAGGATGSPRDFGKSAWTVMAILHDCVWAVRSIRRIGQRP